MHRAHTHRLITRRERAAQSGIRVGSRVTFLLTGGVTGRVNRLTKRATVLVEDAKANGFPTATDTENTTCPSCTCNFKNRWDVALTAGA